MLKTYVISASQYDPNAISFRDYDKNHVWPKYAEVPNSDIRLEKQFESLDDGISWMVENMPTWAIGFAISCKDEPEFACHVVPDYFGFEFHEQGYSKEFVRKAVYGG